LVEPQWWLQNELGASSGDPPMSRLNNIAEKPNACLEYWLGDLVSNQD
jgi:hypothetical protein